jgi:hypothetical protein
MNRTTITAKKLNNELTNLKQKVQIMRSLLIGLVGQDKEGEYRPEFVRKILKAVGEKADFSFRNGKTFLSQLKKYA